MICFHQPIRWAMFLGFVPYQHMERVVWFSGFPSTLLTEVTHCLRDAAVQERLCFVACGNYVAAH